MFLSKTVKLPSELYEKYATIYHCQEQPQRASLLYFHGGGLLYGNREDLPAKHLDLLTGAGYQIIAFDYPLAPAAKLDVILQDVTQSIRSYCDDPGLFGPSPLPYFLWGRSAGAYLALLSAATGSFSLKPSGILSYYGYGFLCNSWFMSPSKYYLTLPPVPEMCLEAIPEGIHATGDLDTHYSVYVYARQTGKWLDMIYAGRSRDLYTDYSLRTKDHLPCPVFCAHCMRDTDVPYSEFLELCQKYNATRFIAPGAVHDFDRLEEERVTQRLLDATLRFLDGHQNRQTTPRLS